MMSSKIFGIGIPLLGLAMAAHAGSFTFDTTAAATDTAGDAVSAQAVITTSANTVSIKLYDLLVNPKYVGQLLSEFDFTLSGTTSL